MCTRGPCDSVHTLLFANLLEVVFRPFSIFRRLQLLWVKLELGVPSLSSWTLPHLWHPFPPPIVIFLRRQWHPTPVLLPGKSHRWRSLVGCCSWGRYESGKTERLHFHFSLSRIGEENGNPLQCSCLENPRDGEAWWASVYRVTQSRTQLKQLSSSSSIVFF